MFKFIFYPEKIRVLILMFMFLIFLLAIESHLIAELTLLILHDQGLTRFNPWIAENYLLALCESDRKTDILQLLETIDIRKISLLDHLASIFKSLGRLLLESDAEKYILAFKTSGIFFVTFCWLYFYLSCCRNSIGNITYKGLIVQRGKCKELIDLL